MEIKLRVTPEKLQEQAGVVERQTKTLKSHFDNIQDVVARSSGYWVGAAGDKARKEFNDQKDDIETVIKRFMEHPGDLLKMAGIYRDTESAVQEQNQALDTDVIA